MTLSAGTKLGPYEILSPLGSGGMGEVYRAKDTRLERSVAVKVLPSHLSASPEVRQRFEREAKTISQLSHPHICALYDVGREGETEYLVMELLEGETLSERLAKGPLAPEQTLRYGQEIADALDKAHRQGIVHRDLKPGNVMLTKSGVKLLDFGLAKAMAPAAERGSLTSLPTQQGLTQEGTILGTFQYMAPEQLEGKEADGRTDVFALGATLYEMATGKKAFTAASQASLITAIMSADPPAISNVVPMSPPALDRVVKKCLAKDPEDRWQSAADLGSELKWIAEGSSAGVASPVTASRRRPSLRLSWIVAGAVAVAAIVLAAALRTHRAPSLPVIRASILPPEGVELVPIFLEGGPVEVSPDGSKLVFTARRGEGPNELWVRELSEPSARPLAGTEGAERPFWSPDSRSIGFFADRALKRIEVIGGPVFTLAEANQSRGGSWNRDGVILFTPDARGPIYRIAAAGGHPVVATEYAKDDATHRYPRFLPDGRHFLFLVRHSGAGADQNPEIRVGSLDSKNSRTIVNAASNVVYASGYLLYVRERALVAQKFDPAALSTSGEPSTLVPDVLMDERFSRGVFSASENGVLVYQTGTARSATVLRWLDREGKILGTVGEPAEFFSGGDPEISPDGTRAAVSIVDLRTGDADIWMVDLATGTRRRFTAGTGDKFWSAWSPDGRRIAYGRAPQRAVAYDIVIQRTDGSGGAETVATATDEFEAPSAFTPDGRRLIYERRKDQRDDLLVMTLEGERTTKPVVATRAWEGMGQLSPDGRYLAYISDETGRFDVYVTAFPGPGGRWQVSQNGGREPRWSKNGKELLFFAPDNRLMVAEVTTGSGGFEVGVIRPLFQSRKMGMTFRYDVAKDGQRFLVNAGLKEELSPITLVTNWTAELEPKK